MVWATFILAIVSAYVAIKLLRLTNSRGSIKFLGLTIAAVIFTLMQVFQFLENLVANADFIAATAFITEWGHVICLALILSSLAVFIRESKPVFAQFPMLYTAFPLLIIISYALVEDTYALKKWLLAIYQGGAIIVALLMYSVYSYRKKEYAVILSGVMIFFICYILFWYVPGVQESYQWIWKILIGIAMVTTVIGYQQTEERIAAQSI